MNLRVKCLVLLLLYFTPLCLAAQDKRQPEPVQSVIDSFHGEIYFFAKDLSSGTTLEFRGGQKVQTASVIKVPILVELFAQARDHRFSLADVVAYTEDNRAPGSGILQDLGLGLQLTLRDLAVLMTALSDNTATNILIDRIGIDAVNQRMRALGLTETTLYRKVFRPATSALSEEEKKWGLGVTTPLEMARLMEMLYRKEVVDSGASEAMLDILSKQRDRDGIPRYLYGEAWNEIKFAHKTGALNQVRNDVAIVYTPAGDYVLSLFAQESQDQKWTSDNEALLVLGRLAEGILKYFRGL